MSKPIDDGGPACPFKCQGPTTAPEAYYGMTLRDWFAGQALNGILEPHVGTKYSQHLASHAYQLADAMIAARNGGDL